MKDSAVSAAEGGSPYLMRVESLHRWHWLLACMMVGIVYVAAARLGLSMAIVHGNVTPVWPPSGIAVAALLVFGMRVIPGLLVASLITNMATGAGWMPSAGIALGNTLEYVVAMLLLRRLAPAGLHQFALHDVGALVIAALVAPLIAATAGTVSLCLAGLAQWSAFGEVAVVWWAGDAAGMFFFCPLILAWLNPESARGRAWELAAACLLGLVLTTLVFRNATALPLAFISFPLVVWAALRLGVRGALSVALCVAAPAIWFTAVGEGLLEGHSVTEAIFLLLSYVLLICGTALAVAASLGDRLRTELALAEVVDRIDRFGDHVPGFIYQYRLRADGTAHFPYASRGIRDIYGCEPDDVVESAAPVFAVLHPDDVQRVAARIAESAAKLTPWQDEYRVCHGGRTRWVRGYSTPVRDADGSVTWHGCTRDVTAEHEAEVALRRAAVVMSASQEGVIITDGSYRIIDVNPAFEAITGFAREEAIGRNPSMLGSGRHAPEFFEAMYRALAETGRWHGDLWNRRKSGEVYPIRMSIDAVRDDGEGLTYYVAVFADQSDRIAHQQALDQAIHFDQLTGLPNRRLLEDRLGMALARSGRSGRPLAVCYLDLDDFKPINERYGHTAGDAVLMHAAVKLKDAVRGGDTVARLGGDDFALVLNDLGSDDECFLLVDRIRASLSEPMRVGDSQISLTAGIGVAVYPNDDATPEALLRHADQAMYLAKQKGPGSFHLFDAEDDRRVHLRRKTLDRIGQGIAAGEFRLFYQPKVDMGSGAVIGAEALLRWQHPELGMQSPIMFLPLVEGSELDIPLGEWVIAEAIRQLEIWTAAGIRLPVSINVSALHLRNPSLPATLAAGLKRHPRVDPRLVELEVVETTSAEYLDQIINVIEDCRALGLGVALDDFGTGQSSLTHLRRIPADVLKIDQSFVRDMLVDRGDWAIIEGVLGFARAFDRQVIAEGVETVQHGVALLSLGCSLAQGYAIARPMPADQLPAWVANWRPPAEWTRQGGTEHATVTV